MRCYKSRDEVEAVVSPAGFSSWSLVDAENGCVNGCMTGITSYTTPTYKDKAYHDFQEGFYAISGNGFAIVGEQEFAVRPGMSFIVPRQTSHQFRVVGDAPLELFWFHAG